jgi:hypothetical protein
MGVYRETSFGHPGIFGRVHLPQAYRSLPRPSSLIKPSHPPIGVFAPVPVRFFYLIDGINNFILIIYGLTIFIFTLHYNLIYTIY